MIGIDLVKISRIDEIINKHGLDFAQKMVGSDADKAETLAGHYAAKEAFAKALGTGLSTDILKNSKADGICVVRAIMDADDVCQTSLDLKEKIQEL